MNSVCIRVNGESVQALVEPRTHLADFLREQLRLTGTHLGCEHGVCGACTVLVDSQPVRSCIAFATACDGQEVRTIEGFEQDDAMAELREAFSREHALQCGFCTPGMLIGARDLVLRVPDADEKRIRVEMSGNLCRCTGYLGIVLAIKSVIEARRARGNPAPRAGVVPVAQAAAAFTPFAVSAAPVPTPDAAAAPAEQKPSNRIEDAFTVEHPLARVWDIFADMAVVAGCLPGAEISEHTPVSLKGKITTKFGPMRATFAGAASLKRDESEKRGTIRGAGTDSLSGSRARGDISYQLFDVGNGYTRVAVAIDYSLQGPLAQFSRGGLVTAFVKKMVADFATNLNARLAAGTQGGAAKGDAPTAQIDAVAVFWKWLWSRIKAVFGG